MSYIYIASPYSHSDSAVREQRYLDVMKYTARCLIAGECVFSPIAQNHTIALHYKMPTDWAFWSKVDYAMIDGAHTLRVLKLDGREKSVGVAAEIEYATLHNKKVEYVEWNPAQ